MLSLVFVGSLLAVPPPALPPEPEPTFEPAGPTEGPAPAPEPIVVVEAEAQPEAGIIVAAPPPGDTLIVIEGGDTRGLEPMGMPVLAPRTQAVPAPPWSGAGRFVGGAFMLTAGLGLLTAATMEFADGRDTTQPVVSQVPAGISMLVAGGIMIGTGVRDQHRLGEWEAATGIDAKPSGVGLIIGGISAVSLGSMAAVVTSIASDMDLDAPRSLPAGWATAGVALGGGTALLIAGIVRRAHYGKWRDRVTGMPMVAPTRAGATVGLVGQF